MTVRDVAGGESRVKGHGGNSWLGGWAAVSLVCSGMALADGASEGIQRARAIGEGLGESGHGILLRL